MFAINLIVMIIEVILVKFVFSLTWPVAIILGIVLGFFTVWILEETDIGDLFD